MTYAELVAAIDAAQDVEALKRLWPAVSQWPDQGDKLGLASMFWTRMDELGS